MMALMTDFMLLDVLVFAISLVGLFYWYFTKRYSYWDKRSVPNVKKDNFNKFFQGNFSQAEVSLELYDHFPGEKYSGFFQVMTPVLVVRDPDLIHKILVKDFVHFQDRGIPRFENDVLTANLFFLRGQAWRALRYKLTPTFSTGKLRGMFDQVSRSGDNMIQKVEEILKENNEIECKTFVFEFTLDIISSCAFGLQVKPGSTEFETFKSAVERMFTGSLSSMLKFSILMASPKLAEALNLKSFPKETEHYFLNMTSANIKYRKDNNIQRNDYYQLLLSLKEQEDTGRQVISSSYTFEDDEVIDQMQYTEQSGSAPTPKENLMTAESICANSFIFLTGGSESTASTISFALLNLALHPDIQQRLQQEIDSALVKRGGWSYDTIKDMTYLDQIVQESQRLYPLIPTLMRECVMPYKLPDSDLVIEKGVLVWIPLMGLHRDPQYYPEPDRFDPDRFEGNNFKPTSTYLPFGDGPRICIAMRFAVMEVKTCLSKIMAQYSVTLGSKTQTPITFNKKAFLPAVEGGIWLNFEKRIKPE